MSAPGLFSVDLPEPPEPPKPEVVPAKPAPKMTERGMLDLLGQRYAFESFGTRRYATAEHVASEPGWAKRIADFIAVDCWRGSWSIWKPLVSDAYGEPWGYPIHGHEVKVSRADWLTELRDPTKADAFRPYVNYWWLVVPDASIVRGDLPDGWGLMVKSGARLRAVVKAPLRLAEPMPHTMRASLLRAVAKTARRSLDPTQEAGE